MRRPNDAAAIVPRPEARAIRVARRPAPLPIWCHSSGERPIVDSRSQATSAAALIANGSAMPANPARITVLINAQPTAPPGPAGSRIGGCRIEHATAPSTSARISIASRRGSRRIGRCSISRNAQPSNTAGSR